MDTSISNVQTTNIQTTNVQTTNVQTTDIETIPNEIPEEYLSQFKSPWKWEKMSNDMIDLIFTDYHYQYTNVILMRKIIRNICLNNDLLRKNNIDSSYLYLIYIGINDNMLYLKKKCSKKSKNECIEYMNLLENLQNGLQYQLNNISSDLKYYEKIQQLMQQLLDNVKQDIDNLFVFCPK